MPAFVTANTFLVRPGCSAPGGISTYQVFLFRALLQSWASQEQFPILHLPSCEANTVNNPSSLGGWKRDICGALSNCTWHMVLRCAREDGWQRMTLLWFFCLLPLSSMMIARDINAEEPEKKCNGNTEGKSNPSLHSAQLWKQTDLLRHKMLHKQVVLLLMHQFPKQSQWYKRKLVIKAKH